MLFRLESMRVWLASLRCLCYNTPKDTSHDSLSTYGD
jgi:hypothetical protein